MKSQSQTKPHQLNQVDNQPLENLDDDVESLIHKAKEEEDQTSEEENSQHQQKEDDDQEEADEEQPFESSSFISSS